MPTDEPEPDVPMVKAEGPLGMTISGHESAAYLAWEARQDGGEGDA